MLFLFFVSYEIKVMDMHCTSQPVWSLLSIHGNYRSGLLFDFVLRPSFRFYL